MIKVTLLTSTLTRRGPRYAAAQNAPGSVTFTIADQHALHCNHFGI